MDPELAKEHNVLKSLTLGDFLREERGKPGSEFGELIKHHITNGSLVPNITSV